jgi:hypothetical protein
MEHPGKTIECEFRGRQTSDHVAKTGRHVRPHVLSIPRVLNPYFACTKEEIWKATRPGRHSAKIRLPLSGSRLSIREQDRNLLISHVQLLACGSLRLKLSQLRHCNVCVVFPIARFMATFPLGCCVSLCHVAPSKVLRDGSLSRAVAWRNQQVAVPRNLKYR